MKIFRAFGAYARFLGTSFAVNLKGVLEYRADFMLQSVGMMLNNGAFALFWGALLARTGGLGGYGFADVMFIWAIVSTSFGIAHIAFGNIRSLAEMVLHGDLDTYLLQPKDVWLNVLASRTIVSAWGDFLYGFIVIALLPGTGLERVALFCALSVTGAAIVTASFAAMESLSFFMGDSRALSSALSEFLLSFSLYPETIFGKELRLVFYTLIPSGFIAFVPLSVFRNLDWATMPLLALAAAVYVLLARALFKAGLKRYESGNRIGARV